VYGRKKAWLKHKPEGKCFGSEMVWIECYICDIIRRNLGDPMILFLSTYYLNLRVFLRGLPRFSPYSSKIGLRLNPEALMA
jgi:hypothetical protein